ncbi:TetR/AcrR family transcriptional regulator C-terminal domain-containing protein [Streptomyces sp. CBMA123]|uniref:TetR/AcrR family transcriptional regulator C-terminal domain-containing protein n=1 Tax=Streptomyces sp. CBMA123 TaxID=1896313 RepID=UPI001661F67A|nr:TetR/AcrR family transcriptional regulator C-terminal domain-containing protein [Streptomyces sp. CBMA123]MBD0693669.1 hypothetical protein [Streptomyces sp. CBMA123]
MALHRDDVIRAALDLLDEVGLERLTTRALTERLGVAPGALYWHVRSKRELLAAMADAVVAPAFTTTGNNRPDGDGPGGETDTDADWAEKGWTEEGWAGRTQAFAHRLRAALLGRRDGARLVSGYLVPGTATLGAVEEGLALMRSQGLTLGQAAVLGHAVTSYVIGFVLQEQTGNQNGDRGTDGDGDGGGMPGIDPARYPNLVQWQTEQTEQAGQAGQGASPGGPFAAGLALLTAGLAAGLD